MKPAPVLLTPANVAALMECLLHYHFLQQSPNLPAPQSDSADLDSRVRKVLARLHAAGGPARLSLAKYLEPVQHYPTAKKMAENYYHRLRRDWPRVMATNEALSLKISLAGVPLQLNGVVDRLDQTNDGGILAILFSTGPEPPPTPDQLRLLPASAVYHALVAAAYPLKRPVRLQQLWLHPNQEITVELSEDEYRANFSRLRDPVRALAQQKISARPGLHCETCQFKANGCPVYRPPAETAADDFDPAPPDGKIDSRRWIYTD